MCYSNWSLLPAGSDSIPEEYNVYPPGQLMGMSGDGQGYTATPTVPVGEYLVG